MITYVIVVNDNGSLSTITQEEAEAVEQSTYDMNDLINRVLDGRAIKNAGLNDEPVRADTLAQPNIEFTPEMVADFEAAYTVASENGFDCFIFAGGEFATSYAKYVLQYLKQEVFPSAEHNQLNQPEPVKGTKPRQHEWIKSSLGHGESMCKHCKITNREAAVLGKLNECDRA